MLMVAFMKYLYQGKLLILEFCFLEAIL